MFFFLRLRRANKNQDNFFVEGKIKMREHIAKYINPKMVLVRKKNSLEEKLVADLDSKLEENYFKRTNKWIPKGKIRSLWFRQNDGYFWKGSILKEIDPDTIPITKRFVSQKEKKVWKWYEIKFKGNFPTDFYSEVDIAQDLLKDFAPTKKRKSLNDNSRSLKIKKVRDEKFPDFDDVDKNRVRTMLLRDFQSYSSAMGEFFILEGPNCRTIKEIEQNWVTYPKTLDIANCVQSTVKTIEEYAERKNWINVYCMKDTEFFLLEKNKTKKYSGIWLDRCCSNPPDTDNWRKILETIIENEYLGPEGILAVTFCKRSRTLKVNRQQSNVNQDRMINLMTEILLSQKSVIKKDHTFYHYWKYQILFIRSESYHLMCTIWWALKLTPLIF